MQTALGFVAAAEGISLVPESVKRLRRDDVIYRNLDESQAISPIIMYARMHDSSPQVVSILECIRDLYRQAQTG